MLVHRCPLHLAGMIKHHDRRRASAYGLELGDWSVTELTQCRAALQCASKNAGGRRIRHWGASDDRPLPTWPGKSGPWADYSQLANKSGRNLRGLIPVIFAT